MGVASATYVDGLANGLARSALDGARVVRQRRDAAAGRAAHGVDRPFITELMLSARFAEVRRWRWRLPGHINVLETGVIRNWLAGLVAAPSACKVVADSIGDAFVLRSSRPFAVGDSEVARLATSKGRSSSYALTPVLEQSAVLQLGGGLFPRFAHSPSKLNVSDDPTRHLPVRPPARAPPSWQEDGVVVEAVLALAPVRGVLAAWARVVCYVLGAGLRGVLERRGEGRRLSSGC